MNRVAGMPEGSRWSLSTWRALALSLAVVALGLLTLLVVGRRRPDQPADLEPPAVAPELVLVSAAFEDLPGWQGDALTGFARAFGRSCEALSARPEDETFDRAGVAGAVGDWLPVCESVIDREPSEAELRRLLERHLRPWAVRDRSEDQALLTGYYEPSLRGSRVRTETFRVPLYRRPPELVTIELGAFREDLRGRRLAGRVSDGRLHPYLDRQQLEAGALAERGLELVWVDDAIAAFFLHIQGSGRIELPDGSVVRVGYAGQNGHPYVAIGRELVGRGEMSLDEVSMQSIRRWLTEHVEAAQEVMEANPSFVFFRELQGDGPVGSQGVALTAVRSLAVDRSFLPLGVPVWLDATAPRADPEEPDGVLRRLMVAQDTGGAIRGPLRGDLFWGHGELAAAIAGRMRNQGRLWILLPKGVQPSAAESRETERR